MANGGEKSWNRPWSMEEMIENAENWSLAGDVALLNTLKAYSENLFKRTVSISDNVDSLLQNLDEVSLRLSLSQNDFQSLRNTQFIENRVYEDDETVDFNEEVKPEQPLPTEEEKKKLMKESVLEGLRVMNKYYDKIEVSISDSEDEESRKSYVLRPKDLYAHRPLPLVIGTPEWYKTWHVGLASSSSESESDKVSETYSDSESGDDLPKDLIKGSETSSDFDLSSRTSENRPVANSTFNEASKRAADEESDGQGSFPAKTPISSRSFAEQLAAKLGDVISEREDVSKEINRKPIQPQQKNKFEDVLFADEPPPLDDLEDTILPKSAQEGLFSGGKGLFDDKDDLFWGQQSKEPSTKPPETEEKTATLPKTSQVSKGPFDSDTESSDDDIFAIKPKKPTKQPFLQPYSTTAPLFDEEPPELEVSKKPVEDTLKKKPVGGVSIFGKTDILNAEVLKSRQQDSVDSSKANKPLTPTPSEQNVRPKHLNLFDEDEVKSLETSSAPAERKPPKISLYDDEEAKPITSAKPKKASLFDEDDDLFKDDLFSGITTKKLTSNLFDDFEDIFSTNVRKKDTSKADLFSDIDEKSTTEQKSVEKPKKKLDLFESDKEEVEGDLFAMDSPPNDTVEEVKEESGSPNQASVADEVDRSVKKVVEDLPQRQVIGAEKLASIQKLARGLFDDSTEESDAESFFREVEVKKTQRKIDLFGGGDMVEIDKNTTESRQIVISEPTGTSKVQAAGPKQEKPQDTEKTKSRNTIDLFGSSPPPDDDDWETKSVPSSDNEDQFSYPVDYNAAASSLFDNEPPSLGANESSGIVRDENITRVDTDDSSFYPYASSSRRLSSEIYNEQQSQDSFFVTKNKTESVGVVPSLDRISEAETSSNLDITPSGKLEDFENSQDSSSAAGDSSVFEKDPPKDSIYKKPVSLFDDSTDSEDLFSSISKTSGLPKLSEKRLSLFDNINDALQGFKEEKPSEKKADSAKVAQSLKDTESEKEKVESTQPEETERKTMNVPEIRQKEPKKPPTGSPGKLKHNLKINVAALLPGSAPPKPRELTKSQSLDLPKEETVTPTDLSSPDLAFFTPTVSSPARDAFSTGSEKAVSFEDALGSVEVLHSVTKDRAKIPIKRRPSTRRGRQRAIQTTASDFTLASGDNATVASPNTPESKTEGVPKSSPSTEDVNTPSFQTPVSDMEHFDADILGDTVNDDVDNFSKTSSDFNSVIETTDLKVDEDLFPGAVNKSFSILGEEKSVDDEDLFGKSTDKDVGVSSREKSIFESEDSDSELFGQVGAKKGKKEGPGKKPDGIKKRPLFNDGSSDEDLFLGTGTGDSRKKDAQKAVEKKAQKSSTTRKLANIETDEDPLSSLLK